MSTLARACRRGERGGSMVQSLEAERMKDKRMKREGEWLRGDLLTFSDFTRENFQNGKNRQK